MRSDTRLIVLPQTITVTLDGKQLQAALDADRFPHMQDDRDNPGTVDAGVSRLDGTGRYGYSDAPNPVPGYWGAGVIRISREDYSGFFPQARNFDIIQVTKTPMSPPVAEAFIGALAEDPTHPFVLSHLIKGMDLNGSDSWLTVGGPALAIPLSWVEPADARSRRSKDYVPHKPDGEDRDLTIQVENHFGLRGEDFIAAARRHESLGAHGIIVGDVQLVDLEPLSHRMDENSFTGAEVPMFRLAYDDDTIGLYATAQDAQNALETELLHGSRYKSTGTIFAGPSLSEYRGRYTVEGCLVLDGQVVRPGVNTELVSARATVRARVATVDPAIRRVHTGWMLVWQATDWHRNREHVTQYLNEDGTVFAERRSHWR